MWIIEHFGRNPARARDPVGRRLDVERRPEIDAYQVVARFEPSLQLDRRDTSFPEMTQEVLPTLVLERDVANQSGGDGDDQRSSEAGGLSGQQTDDLRAEIAERDPGSGP